MQNLKFRITALMLLISILFYNKISNEIIYFQNSRAFGMLMTLGLLGLNVIITYLSTMTGDMSEWSLDFFRPNGFNTVRHFQLD